MPIWITYKIYSWIKLGPNHHPQTIKFQFYLLLKVCFWINAPCQKKSNLAFKSLLIPETKYVGLVLEGLNVFKMKRKPLSLYFT